MRTPLGAFIFICVLLLIDWYVYQALRAVSAGAAPRTKTIIQAVYWGVSALVAGSFLLLLLSRPDLMPRPVRNFIFAMIAGLFLAKLTIVFFVLLDDIRRLLQWVGLRLFWRPAAGEVAGGVSRSVFLSWLGLAAGGTLFGSLLYGFGNKYRYQVNRLKLSFDSLPEGFKGLKMVHISDIHSGSFNDRAAVKRGVEKILKESPDIILFTGDLVNDMAVEMEEYKEVFAQLKAPLGVYSTLGNHDYGDYVRWPQNGISKEQNLENLKKVHADMGWRLLMNEHVELERKGDRIALLGIENWSNRGRFPKYGRLKDAYAGTEVHSFKILLSHDPSHWEAEVQPHYSDIDLMLSGHTHGMQFGVEVPGFRWSPVQYIYKQWAGLYENGRQKLYVNRGFGFIGYPGRVGILPEITVIELV